MSINVQGFLDAISLIAERETEKIKYDKTVVGQVVSCEDAAAAIYLVEFQGKTFEAHAYEGDSYKKDEFVYLLFPSSASDNIVISGSAKSIASDVVKIKKQDADYEKLFTYNYPNSIVLSESHRAIAIDDYYFYTGFLNDAQKHFQIGTVYKVEFDVTFNHSIPFNKQSNLIDLGFNSKFFFKAFEVDEEGEQTEVLALDTNQNYTLSIGKMTGSPKSIGNKLVHQEYYFKIDGASDFFVRSAPLPSESALGSYFFYINVADWTDADYDDLEVTFSNLTLSIYEDFSLVEAEDYKTNILTENGNSLLGNDHSTLMLEADFTYKDSSFENRDVKYYWFKRDYTIDENSDYYNIIAGLYWKCLNDKQNQTIVSYDEDSHTMTEKIEKVFLPLGKKIRVGRVEPNDDLNDFPYFKQTNYVDEYKCVVVYKNINISSPVVKITDGAEKTGFKINSKTIKDQETGTKRIELEPVANETTPPTVYYYKWIKEDNASNLINLSADYVQSPDNKQIYDLTSIKSYATFICAYFIDSSGEKEYKGRATLYVSSAHYLSERDETFKRLFNNGQNQGIFTTENGYLYLNAEYVRAGRLEVVDDNDNIVFYADKDEPDNVIISGFTASKNTLSIGSLGQEDSVFMSTGVASSTSIGGSTGQKKWCFTAGSSFGVTTDGDLYADAGKIAGFNIINTILYSETYYLCLTGTWEGTSADKVYFYFKDQNALNQIFSDTIDTFYNNLLHNNPQYLSKVISSTGVELIETDTTKYYLTAADSEGNGYVRLYKKEGTSSAERLYKIQAKGSPITLTRVEKKQSTIVTVSPEGISLISKNVITGLTDNIFSVNDLGQLTATDVNLRGNITATSGQIAGFTIDGNDLYNGTVGSTTYVLMSPGKTVSGPIGNLPSNQTWSFLAGQKFGVTNEGNLYATNAILTGEVNAISGKIASFKIDNDFLLGQNDYYFCLNGQWTINVNNSDEIREETYNFKIKNFEDIALYNLNPLVFFENIVNKYSDHKLPVLKIIETTTGTIYEEGGNTEYYLYASTTNQEFRFIQRRNNVDTRISKISKTETKLNESQIQLFNNFIQLSSKQILLGYSHSKTGVVEKSFETDIEKGFLVSTKTGEKYLSILTDYDYYTFSLEKSNSPKIAFVRPIRQNNNTVLSKKIIDFIYGGLSYEYENQVFGNHFDVPKNFKAKPYLNCFYENNRDSASSESIKQVPYWSLNCYSPYIIGSTPGANNRKIFELNVCKTGQSGTLFVSRAINIEQSYEKIITPSQMYNGFIFHIGMISQGTNLQIQEQKFIGTWTETVGQGTSSDQRLKNTISNLDSKYSILFDNLIPVTYKYNDGTSNRLHTGFIAQDVQSAISAAGLTEKDFAGIISTSDKNGESYYSLRYSEFIALCVKEIQTLKQRVAALENN